LTELREWAELNVPPSVGIITPHTEQQALLVQLINRQDDAERLNEALDLKIMTFDTCQGEERDVILYSMVATQVSDKLAYVFPREPSGRAAEGRARRIHPRDGTDCSE
jgi:superfamily I DNA and/or RNA helicase